MVNLLFPAVTVRAESLQRAPLVVVSDESPSLPILAEIARLVVEEVGLAPKILPVVRVNTLRLVVLIVKEGAPLSLEVEHVEFLVARVLVDQASFNVELRVCKRAELSVGAFIGFADTELGLVLLQMVEPLYIAVSQPTRFPLGTVLRRFELAEVRLKEYLHPAPVNL